MSRFLKAGGALFAFGGYAFDETEDGVRWPTSAEMDVENPVPDQLNTYYVAYKARRSINHITER